MSTNRGKSGAALRRGVAAAGSLGAHAPTPASPANATTSPGKAGRNGARPCAPERTGTHGRVAPAGATRPIPGSTPGLSPGLTLVRDSDVDLHAAVLRLRGVRRARRER